MTEPLIRTGRGGAGNWYAKKDVEEAQKQTPSDLEAQKPTSPPIVSPSAAGGATVGGYARAGRGGAGNFHDADALAPAQVRGDEAAQATARAVAASQGARPRGGGLGGRGGAGNWAVDAASLEAEREREESRKKEAIETRVVMDVEAGLAMPARAYRAHEREIVD